MTRIDDLDLVVAVYGTLRRGGRNEGLLEGATHLGTGTIEGGLHEMVTEAGRPYPYPGVVAEEGGRVVVEIVRLADPGQLARLDALEDYNPADEAASEYLRRRVAVAGGPVAEAWAYLYAGPPGAIGPQIDSGDWIAHVRGSAD